MVYERRAGHYDHARRIAEPPRRVIPHGCVCGGTFLLSQSTLTTLDECRAAVEGQGTTLSFLAESDLPLRRDSYTCERGCVGGASRLVNKHGDTVHMYGRPGVRVW